MMTDTKGNFMMKMKEKQQEMEIPNTPFRFLLKMSRPYWIVAVLAIGMEMAAAGLYQAVPILYKSVIDGAESMDEQKVFFAIALIPITLFFILMLHRLGNFIAKYWIVGSRVDSVGLLTTYVFQHSYKYFTDRPSGSLLNKINNVAHSQEELISEIIFTYFSVGTSFVTTFIILCSVDTQIGLLFGLLICLLVTVNIFLVPHKRRFSKEYAEAESDISGQIVDILSNSSVVRQYSRFDFEIKNVSHFLSQIKTTAFKSWNFTDFTFALNNVVLSIFLAFLCLLAYTKWKDDAITTGELTLVISIIINIAYTIIWIGRAFSNWAKVFGRMEEGLAELIVPYEITNTPDAKKLSVQKGEVKWSDVTFEYGENKVFDSFNLTIKPGERVGLVGSSGAGKTTFVSLLLRQHDIGSGAITIDGQNIAEVTQDSLRENIAVVPQEPMLFHRTIRENIAYGKPDATDAEIIAVAKKAQAHDFIAALPEAYETMVGERGIKLSGGQKQRVAIARAMLKNAPILVLDEATSALDSESEVAIQKALHELMEGKTVVAIAHRLSTLREMDRVLVLEQGKVIEDGKHAKLAKAGGLYQRLWEHQAGGFLQE